jgi:hypothetical protein
MSFWNRLFGGGAPKGEAPGLEEDYRGYTIRSRTVTAGREFQVAGSIEKVVGGELKRHDFVRADRLPSRDEAAQFSMTKARQIIDEQGDRLFR